jgi:dihydroorotase
VADADLLIKNGTIVTETCTFGGTIAINNGKISSLSSRNKAPSARKVIDATGLHILPGVIDVHVHLRDPGFKHKEDFGSGTAAAAAGGVATIFDMPNNSPPPKNIEALNEKIEAAKKAIVDYGLYGLLTKGNTADLLPLAERGVIGYKCYMGETVGGILPPNDGEMIEQFAVASRSNLRVSVHAENDSILQYRTQKLKSEGRRDAHAHYESRPDVVEEEAVRRALLFAAESECKLHIAHVSGKRTLEALLEAKRKYQPVTAETCPHYLLLDEEQYATIGSLMKINPPIRTASDKEALWAALNNDTIEMIATDHSPHTLDEKTKPVIFDCLSGFAGLETAVPLMLTQVNKGMLPLTTYVKLTSTNPARAWGLYPQKGATNVGSDADFTIVDMTARSKVDPAKFYSKAKWSPFDGFEVQGLPVYTIVRGNVVMDHGNVDTTPVGKMVSPLRGRG